MPHVDAFTLPVSKIFMLAKYFTHFHPYFKFDNVFRIL